MNLYSSRSTGIALNDPSGSVGIVSFGTGGTSQRLRDPQNLSSIQHNPQRPHTQCC
jgi:hypothetical protein